MMVSQHAYQSLVEPERQNALVDGLEGGAVRFERFLRERGRALELAERRAALALLEQERGRRRELWAGSERQPGR